MLLRGVSPSVDSADGDRGEMHHRLGCWCPGPRTSWTPLTGGRVNLDDYLLDQWRLMHIGAQPVPPSLIHRWKRVFPHHLYDTNYGLSESIGPGCVHLGVENIDKVGAIGKPGYLWQAKVVDEQGNEVSQGQVGELIVCGPGVMQCYYKNPEGHCRGAQRGLAVHRRHGRGGCRRLHLPGGPKEGRGHLRRREPVSGSRSRPSSAGFEKIKDVAVIGLPDTRLGEIAAAIVEVKDGVTCTEEEINAFCQELPRYKRPRKIIFDKIPRNPSGKIEKPGAAGEVLPRPSGGGSDHPLTCTAEAYL